MTNTDKKVTFRLSNISKNCETFDVDKDSGSGSFQSSCLSERSDSCHSNLGSFTENGEEAMKWIANQVKGLQTAISVPLLQVVRSFDGNPSQFKEWVKDIEKYAHMTRLDNTGIPRIDFRLEREQFVILSKGI